MSQKFKTIGGHRLERQDEWWLTPDHRFKFRKAELTSVCRSPHANTKGYCWGDTEHTRTRFEAYDGDKNITVAPDGWKKLTEAVEYALWEYNPDN